MQLTRAPTLNLAPPLSPRTALSGDPEAGPLLLPYNRPDPNLPPHHSPFLTLPCCCCPLPTLLFSPVLISPPLCPAGGRPG